MSHCFLVKPKRFVGEAIPHFREEPSERVGAAFKAFSQSDGIAKTRRIPEDELAAILTAGEKVVIRCFCNMSTVGNLTHVTHEQCSGERCFADVRVAHKAQVNAQGILLVGHGESIDQSNSFIIARGE